jgi:hypothetical protein
MRELLYESEETMTQEEANELARQQGEAALQHAKDSIPCGKKLDGVITRLVHLEDEYAQIKKTFADLVPVLDAIIESQRNLESAIKPMLGPQIIQ